jgi:hypothetical protein
MGWTLLNQEEPDEKEKLPDMDGPDMRSLEQKVFYPFTFPITAGPGCIVVMVTLSAHASGKAFLSGVMAHAGIAIAVMLLSVAVYFCYGHAPTITARISPQTVHGVLRLIAFVLLAGFDLLEAGAQRVPTFSAWPNLCLNHGCIGGAYIENNDTFELTAKTAARVLSGEPVDKIPVTHVTDLRFRVDWRALQRWHIPESAFASG